PGRQAIHSEMMAPVAAKFKEYMARFSFHKPQIPYISNVTGKWLTGRDTVGPLYWARHLQETVRFADGINELIKEPDAIFVEIGPGRDLSSLIKRYTENNPGQKVINMLKPAQSNIPDMSYLLKKIGFLWLWGVKIDWDQFYLYEKRCRVPLPAYPFEKHSYSLLNKESFKTGAGFLEGRSFRGGKRESNERLYIPSWKRIRGLSLSQDEARQAPEKSPWLILIDQMGIGDGLAKKLGHEGHDVITVEAGEISTGFQKKTDRHFMINPGKEHDACWDELFNELEKSGLLPRKIIHCWCITPNGNAGDLETGNVNQFQDLGYYSLLNIARALGKQDLKNKFHIAVISNNMQEVSGEENLCPAKSTLLGPVKVIPFEYANITCQSIDITVPSVLAGSKQAGKSINQLTGELLAKSFEPVMALRGSHLWVQTFEHILLPGPGEKTMPLKQGGVYLITGGLGGIGMAIAKYLAEHFRARLILIGRTAITRLPGQPVENKDIQELEQLGAQVLVFSADVSNREDMQNVIAQAVTHFGQIHGVIHAAVVPDGAVIQRRTRETSERIFTSKIAGTIVLAQVLADIPLDFFVLCSSINAVLGGIGQVGYCAANNFLDAFAAFQFAAKGIPMVSINWERWQNTGIARIGEAMHKKLTGEDLAGGITPAAGWDYLLRIISDPMPQVLVSDFDLLKQFKTVSAVPAVSSAPAAPNIDAVIDAAGISRDPAKKAHHRPALAAEYAPPRYDMERDLIRTWSDFFGYEKIGIYDDFFELGGDSLKAIVLTTRIHKELHIKISLADIFRNPTIALLAGYLKDKNKDEEYYGITSAQKCNSAMPDRANKFQEIEPVEKRQYYPQSAAQKRFFFLEQFENINSSCHIFFAFTVEGQLNIQRLRQALKNLIECHEALRTSFRIYNNELIQVISEKEMVEFDIEYLQVLQNELEGIIKNFSRPFDISRAPLLRVGVCELSPGRYILLYDIHHIIGDGISLEIMVEDFFKFYNGEILPVPALQYKDFAVWQDKLYKSGELKKQEEYWLNLFSGEIPHLNLPYDYPREAYISFQGDNYLFNLGKEITGQLNAIGLEAGATVYMNLLALLNILFYHYTSQKDIVIGTGIMGRSHASLHRIAGIFVNMLAMRNYPAGEKTYLEFLQEVKENCIKAFDNQDFPFDELIDKLKLSKSLSLSPLFDVELSLTNYETAKIQQEYLDDLKIYPYNFENKNTKFDLILYANEIEDGMHFVFKYATALFRKDTIEKLARHFIEITEQVTANKEIKISNIILSHELVLLKQPGLDEETTADFNF
ncbi:MAG TPA: SDR family NAD(P)-dependent oxidoreductase, partial [Candidatus Kapabacteria bacterium]|nr:SDR family NAD(P)-dependent oxidoreductase [Candidatus Kapabacteria bacterium]